MKRVVGVVSAAGLLMGIGDAAGAITWGEFDDDGHPHVVSLAYVQDGEGFSTCTGTLLSPTLVVTAGHCAGWVGADGATRPNVATYVTNEPDINVFIDRTRPNYSSTQAWLDAEWVSGQAVPHPEYAAYAAFPDTFDIGVVVLEGGGIDTGGTYGELPALGQFDHLRTAKGPPSRRQVEIVGYGLVGRIPAFADDDVWQRQFGRSTIINTGQSNNAGPQNFLFTNNPGRGTGVGGTCSGDSGGPAFWIDPATGRPTNVVLAVNSFSRTPNCNGNDYQFRTDTAVAQTFLAGFIA